MQCRIPKKMKLSGNATSVAAVIARADPPTLPSRSRNGLDRRPFAWASDRPIPARTRNDPAMVRANQRQPGSCTMSTSTRCRTLRSQAAW
jgi:hypothetical protein